MSMTFGVTHRHAPRPQHFVLLVVVASLVACAGMRGNDSDRDYLYRADDDYVRLEPIERGAAPNAHPFTMSAAQLHELLAPLKVSRADRVGAAAVFLKEELDEIVPPLASALAKA